MTQITILMNRITILNRIGTPRLALFVDDRPLQEHFVGTEGDHPFKVVAIESFFEKDGVGVESVEELLALRSSALPSGRVPILVCELCGDLGCGVFAVRIELGRTTVTWTDWAYENGYEPPRQLEWPTYPERLVFDRREYEEAFARLFPSGKLPAARSTPAEETREDEAEACAKAAFAGDIASLRCLLDAGAGIDALGRVWNPLHAAIEGDHVACIQLLLSRGASVEYPMQDNYTPLAHAVDLAIDGTIQTGGQQGDEPTEVILLLLEAGADPGPGLKMAELYRSSKIIQLLAGRRASPPRSEWMRK